MSGIFAVTVSEARGYVAVPADLDRLSVVMGCASAGTPSTLSAFFSSGSAAQTAIGYGDASDTLCQIIEQRGVGNKIPAAFWNMPEDTAGAYGTIATTVAGTAVVANGSTAPFGTYEAKIVVDVGGTLGAAGIAYRYSLDNGRNYSARQNLGTGYTLTIPNSGVSFYLGPPTTQVTALVTLVNDLRTDALAHFAITSGSPGVHGAADTTSGVGIGSAATTGAEAITLVNQILVAHGLHYELTAGGVHGAIDETAIVAIDGYSAATTTQEAITLANALKAAYNGHRARTTLSVHGSADSTNVTTAPDATHGTLAANDLWTVRTTAPIPSNAGITAAFAALAAASADFSVVVCEFPMTAARAALVSTGLDALAAAGKRCTVLARSRIRDFETSETEQTWYDAVVDEFDSFTDSRICIRAGYGFITDAMTSRGYLRSTFAQFCADVLRVGISDWPACPADRAEPNVSLVDTAGTTYGHDEGPRGAVTGLSNDTLGNRFACEMRLPDPTRREAVYNTVPWVCYATDERIRTLMVRRIANAMERVAVSAATAQLGGKLFYVPADPAVPSSTDTLTEASRIAVQSVIFQALTTQFRDHIQNATDSALDTGLVQVSPEVTVSSGLLTLDVTLAPLVFGYLLTLNLTLAVQE